MQRSLNFHVYIVLAQRIHGPDSCWNPADQRQLQDEADDASDRPADGEKCQPREK